MILIGMKSVAFSALIVGLVGVSTGCGKSLSDAQTQDVGNLLGGLGSPPGKSAASLRAPSAGETTGPSTLVDRVNGIIYGELWLQAFKAQAAAEARDQASGQNPEQIPTQTLAQSSVETQVGLAPFTGTNCPASTTYVGMSCTASCTSDGTKATDTCKLTGASQKEVCNGTTYTASNESVSFTIDMSGITGSGKTISGNFVMSVGFSANVTGGNLTGDLVACNIAISLDLGALIKGTATGPVLTCGDSFSCTYGGTKAPCDKFQSAISSVTACTASST